MYSITSYSTQRNVLGPNVRPPELPPNKAADHSPHNRTVQFQIPKLFHGSRSRGAGSARLVHALPGQSVPWVTAGDTARARVSSGEQYQDEDTMRAALQRRQSLQTREKRDWIDITNRRHA